jgi:hypothetical protein
MSRPSELNEPLGQRAADHLAVELGLDKAKTFTAAQYQAFVTGGGRGGDRGSAELVDKSVLILTNTKGRPRVSKVGNKVVKTVLASYGLFVDPSGILESPANGAAATRQVNAVIAPGGYMSKWCKRNGASAALDQLYRSAYSVETVYGFKAQQQTDEAQLAPNDRDGVSVQVGMSMAPPLWIVNFALIYTLNPGLAAAMPAYWAPIPAEVAHGLEVSPHGRVPYRLFAADLPE